MYEINIPNQFIKKRWICEGLNNWEWVRSINTYGVLPKLDRAIFLPVTFMNLDCMNLVRGGIWDLVDLGAADVVEILSRWFELYISLQLVNLSHLSDLSSLQLPTHNSTQRDIGAQVVHRAAPCPPYVELSGSQHIWAQVCGTIWIE